MWSACAFLNALFFDDGAWRFGGWEFIFVRHYVRLLPFTSGLIQLLVFRYSRTSWDHTLDLSCGLDRGVFGLEPRDVPAPGSSPGDVLPRN
jgi:hypothetical protein